MKRNLYFAFGALAIGILAACVVYFHHYFYPQHYVKDDRGIYMNITTTSDQDAFPITKRTVLIMEYDYPDTGRRLTETLEIFPELLGCDKEGLQLFLENYMKRVPMEEREQGLQSYELVAYHDHVITLRKTYRVPEQTGFYAKSNNGMIVIMKGDEKTVYEYTQIPINLLPENIQKLVLEGYFLEDEKALYNFLENYSS